MHKQLFEWSYVTCRNIIKIMFLIKFQEYFEKMYLCSGALRQPMGVLHFFIKIIFYDKMNLRYFYFHLAIYMNFELITFILLILKLISSKFKSNHKRKWRPENKMNNSKSTFA